jgi:hypothetical protein
MSKFHDPPAPRDNGPMRIKPPVLTIWVQAGTFVAALTAVGGWLSTYTRTSAQVGYNTLANDRQDTDIKALQRLVADLGALTAGLAATDAGHERELRALQQRFAEIGRKP